ISNGTALFDALPDLRGRQLDAGDRDDTADPGMLGDGPARPGEYDDVGKCRKGLNFPPRRQDPCLGLGKDVGSLEVGKFADLAAFSLDAVGPTYDPEVAAVFALSGSRARFVTVAGNPVLVDHRVFRARGGVHDSVQSSALALSEWLEAGGELQPLPPAGIS